MMGFGPSDAKQLTYWEYTAMLTEYNSRHDTEEKVDAPDAAFFDAEMERLRNTPAMLS